MSQQVLDLRRSVQLVRRHRLLVSALTVFGILLGCAYSVLRPPLLTSTTLVVFPQSTQSAAAAAAAANGTGANAFTATLEVIAGSNQVLEAALPDARPVMSFQQLRRVVSIGSATTNIVSISAEAKTAVDAETTANAVAKSYINYVNSPNSPIGSQSAALLEPAVSASGTKPLEALIVTGFLGGLAGLLIGAIVSVAISRGDRRLHARDEIANSVGLPVLASFPAARPSNAAGWTKLLQAYRPGDVHAWRLRTALRRLGVTDDVINDARDGSSSSLAVLSLASDPEALALGPQLAVFAASIGIPTTLVIGPQQDENVTASLRTACAVPLQEAAGGRTQPNTAVCYAGDFDGLPAAALNVVVAVVDAEAPRMPDTLRTTATVLGVSAGAATAEQLARTAVSAALDGREIVGILVANPDSGDHTTGQVPRLSRLVRRRIMPTRLNGMTTEIRR